MGVSGSVLGDECEGNSRSAVNLDYGLRNGFRCDRREANQTREAKAQILHSEYRSPILLMLRPLCPGLHSLLEIFFAPLA